MVGRCCGVSCSLHGVTKRHHTAISLFATASLFVLCSCSLPGSACASCVLLKHNEVHVGRQAAELLQLRNLSWRQHRDHFRGFNMKMAHYNPSSLNSAVQAACKAVYLHKAELIASADHFMLCLPCTLASHRTITAFELAQMKPTATFFSIRRGGVVDVSALAVCVQSRCFAAAGHDVCSASSPRPTS